MAYTAVHIMKIVIHHEKSLNVLRFLVSKGKWGIRSLIKNKSYTRSWLKWHHFDAF